MVLIGEIFHVSKRKEILMFGAIQDATEGSTLQTLWILQPEVGL